MQCTWLQWCNRLDGGMVLAQNIYWQDSRYIVWRSFYFCPTRPAIKGVTPAIAVDRLTQRKWIACGLVNVLLCRSSPLFYGFQRLMFLQRIAYITWCLFIVCHITWCLFIVCQITYSQGILSHAQFLACSDSLYYHSSFLFKSYNLISSWKFI